jgi:hypothetical protein
MGVGLGLKIMDNLQIFAGVWWLLYFIYFWGEIGTNWPKNSPKYLKIA